MIEPIHFEPSEKPEGIPPGEKAEKKATRVPPSKDVLEKAQHRTEADTQVAKERAGAALPVRTLPPCTSPRTNPMEQANYAVKKLAALSPPTKTAAPAPSQETGSADFYKVAEELKLEDQTLQQVTINFEQRIANMNMDQLMQMINTASQIDPLQQEIQQDQEALDDLKKDIDPSNPTSHQAELNYYAQQIQALNKQVYMLTLRSLFIDLPFFGLTPVISYIPNTNPPQYTVAKFPDGTYVVDPVTFLFNCDPSTHQPWVDAAGKPFVNAQGEPLIDPTTGIPLLDPSTGQPYLNPETHKPFFDPETGCTFSEASVQDDSGWDYADWGPIDLYGSYHDMGANYPIDYDKSSSTWRSIAPPIDALLQSPVSALQEDVQTRLIDSGRFSWDGLTDPHGSGLWWLRYANLQDAEKGIEDNGGWVAAYNIAVNHVNEDTPVVEQDKQMIIDLQSKIPSEIDKLGQIKMKLLSFFGVGPGQFNEDDVTAILQIVAQEKQLIQKLIDAYNNAHGGDALSCYMMMRNGIINTDNYVSRVVGLADQGLLNFSLAETNELQTISAAMDQMLTQLRTVQDRISYFQTQAQNLSYAAIALTAALAVASIVNAFVSALTAGTGAIVMTAICVALGAALGAVTVAMGSIEVQVGRDMREVSAKEKQLAAQKQEYARDQAISQQAQSVSDIMLDNLGTIMKRTQEMMKSSNVVFESYQAIIQSQQHI